MNITLGQWNETTKGFNCYYQTCWDSINTFTYDSFIFFLCFDNILPIFIFSQASHGKINRIIFFDVVHDNCFNFITIFQHIFGRFWCWIRNFSSVQNGFSFVAKRYICAFIFNLNHCTFYNVPFLKFFLTFCC